MWENAYFSIKNPKASSTIEQTLTTSLVQCCFVMLAFYSEKILVPPLPELDPLLPFVFGFRKKLSPRNQIIKSFARARSLPVISPSLIINTEQDCIPVGCIPPAC